MDVFSKYRAITDTLRNQMCELELVTRLYKTDGTTQEVIHARRAVCKAARRRGNVTYLSFADLDVAELDRTFPFETFTVADFPELFVDHVGKRIPQGVGTARKVELAWITKTGGTWKYAGPKVIGSAGTVLAVYRGSRPGEGAVVDPSEYTVSTATGGSSGVQVVTVNFTREQIDFQGRPYVIEADFSLPGSRAAAAEVARILDAFGVNRDTASFTTAIAADTASGFLVDTLYGAKDATGKAILRWLLNAARGWLSRTSTGGWAITQDVARAATATFDTEADQFEVEEYGDGDIQKTVTLEYRPKISGTTDFAAVLSRTTTGQTGELKLENPYVSDHTVADKLVCYWQKRLNTLRRAAAAVHAEQLSEGSVISITDSKGVAWTGTKSFIATGIGRPADRNVLKLREYDAGVYVYTAGTLPADATNTYAPDYSFTTPTMPTGLTVVSQGTRADSDGKLTSYALIRATPPAVNWQRLMIQVKDTTTNEIYQAQLRLVSGNYEATVSGLRPNRGHEVIAWAVNAANLDGAVTAAVSFTSANHTSGPSAPASSPTVQQRSPRQVEVSWNQVTPAAGAPGIRRYIVFRQDGGGSFVERIRIDALKWIDDNVSLGTGYTYKVRAEDMVGNESADSNTASITPVALIDDSLVVNSGINGISIGNGSINRGRTSSTTGSASGTFNGIPGVRIQVNMALYTFAPMVYGSGNIGYLTLGNSGLGDDTGTVTVYDVTSGGSSTAYDVRWRNVIS